LKLLFQAIFLDIHPSLGNLPLINDLELFLEFNCTKQKNEVMLVVNKKEPCGFNLQN
jgi:hypothetical protein